MGRTQKIVLASANAGKLHELAALLVPLAIEVVPQAGLGVCDADETGTTFEENAIIKAQHAVDATGLPAIADDSGLVVDALDGRPGVYSARYAGPDATDESNIDKLLQELDGVVETERAAAFHCVACYAEPGIGEPILAHGRWRGEILTARRGVSGFGYDPVFKDPVSGLASAELTAEEKNARSHRGQALRKLVAKLE